MPRQAHVLTVLIASPGDVQRQREVIAHEVDDWNRGRLGRDQGVRLESVRWELDAVPELGAPSGQAVINRQLGDECDIVIAIFHSRLGTATPEFASGTAEEIQGAVDRGLPVHVYVDISPIPRDHDPDQLANLNDYVQRLQGGGLLAEVMSDDDLARQVRRALDKDVADFLRQDLEPQPRPASSPSQPTRTVHWRDRINLAADKVLDLDALAPGQRVNGEPDWISVTFEQRRAEIIAGMEPLLQLVIEAVRTGDAAANEPWLDLIPTMAPNPHASGSTRLLALKRAPGALLFHTAGVAACAARDDQLTGRLLSPLTRVDDPYGGPRPAVVSLRAELAFPTTWPSKQLHDYVVPRMSPVVGQRAAGEAWERWTYLCAVATTYFSAAMPGVWVDHPYLKVSGNHVSAMSVVVGEPIRRSIIESGVGHALLHAGFCDGDEELFLEAATTFESNYGEWARRVDWDALPQGGGAFPSHPHYPGDPP